MNILVIGGGGREHALVWKLNQSPKVKRIFSAPGNAGIEPLAQCVDIAAADIPKLVAFAKENRIDLTVVGPEAPLAAGIVDVFKEEDLNIFGPSKEAAKLEASKIYAKEFCDRHQIPQAPFQIFNQAKEAYVFVESHTYPLVIKADGLAQGKGAVVCQNKKEAYAAIDKMLVKKDFGEAGLKIVIEDFLDGEEASFMAVVDGHHILPLASAKDHKRLLEGDKGPNTGGMGAFSPSPLVTPSLYEKIMERILKPVVRGMFEEGHPFVGFLYAGLMIANGEPKLLELNVRLGDPEAQVILIRLKTDLVDCLEQALAGKLGGMKLSWETQAASTIVMASKGYPERVETGLPIQGLKEVEDLKEVVLFHAGTKIKGGRVVTAGGRVLSVTALGKNVAASLQKAYQACDKISWQGCYYRRDIGRVYG